MLCSRRELVEGSPITFMFGCHPLLIEQGQGGARQRMAARVYLSAGSQGPSLPHRRNVQVDDRMAAPGESAQQFSTQLTLSKDGFEVRTYRIWPDRGLQSEPLR